MKLQTDIQNIEKKKYFNKNKEIVKPFLKWAGGKGQLLSEIEKYYPFRENENITKYAEPFVGGGAVLFDIIAKYGCKLEDIYISDINAELINTYIIIQNSIDDLINLLSEYQYEYIPLEREARKLYYNDKRISFNTLCLNNTQKENIEKAALMIFLNKTCFNGLYRVNKKGLFNVPMGDYKKPLICDEKNLYAVSKYLQNVKIICGDYKMAADFIDEKTFVYIDPPYRPISETSSFTAYTANSFSDNEQAELAEFVDHMTQMGAKVVVSNSDPKNINIDDNFFENLYHMYRIKRVSAKRMINSKAENRGNINELLIYNF